MKHDSWPHLTPSLTSMLVVAETSDAVYVRLSPELQRDCGGCDCQYCKQDPILAKWDTLVVPKKIGNHTYVVHMPVKAIQAFRDYIHSSERGQRQ